MDVSTLPADAARRIEGLLVDLDETMPDIVSGLHVVGSIALDDYQPGHSDIDVVVVTRHPLGEADVGVIESIHQRQHVEGGSRIQASYLTTSSLATSPDPRVPSISSLEGKTSYGTDFEVNPVTWRCLIRHAVAVRGTPPALWMRDPTDARVAEFCRINLVEYWQPLAEQVLQHPGPAEARMLEWLGLGPARLARTIDTGEIISKSAAGRQMLEQSPASERAAFDAALAARRGDITPDTIVDFDLLAEVARATLRLAGSRLFES